MVDNMSPRRKISTISAPEDPNSLTPAGSLNDPRLVLRHTGTDKLPAPANSRRRWSTVSANNVSDSTTSEVNSDDDAASIVSRISQIIVEQEEILKTSDNEVLPGNMRSRSRSLVYSLDSDQVNSSTKSINVSVLELGTGPTYSPNSDQDSNTPKRFSEYLPKICVIGDGEQQQQQQQYLRDTLSSLPDRPTRRSYIGRTDIQCSNTPERGDLRWLGSNRNLNASVKEAPSSEKLIDSSMEKLSGDQPMLNIRRSTWTLSEFEQTFKKLDTEKNSATQVVSDIPAREGSFDNVFMIAKNNSINLKPRLTPSLNSSLLPASKNISLTNDCLNERRHSFVSLASSSDSKYNRHRLSRARKRSPGDATNDEDNDSSCIRSCCNLDTLREYVPIIEWLPAYKLDYLCSDLLSGINVTVLNISTSITASVVAETDISVALRASIFSTFVYAIFCSSRHTSFGSWSIMSQMLLVSVQWALGDEFTLRRLDLNPIDSWDEEEFRKWHLNIIVMYTFLIGVIQLVCGILNMGQIVSSFISEATCSSMITATAIIMSAGQLANMCGVSNKILWSIERNTTQDWADTKRPPSEITDMFSDLFRWARQLALLVKHNDLINISCVLISTIAVIVLFFNQYFIQKQLEKVFKRKILIPVEMMLTIVMVILSYALNLGDDYHVPTCEAIHLTLDGPNLPDLRLIRELWCTSLVTALISYTMVHIMNKTYSNKFNYDIDYNQELIACGAGNLVGGLFDAMPSTASFSRSNGQVEAGGKTQMASIFNCIFLFGLAKSLGHHAAVLPVCVMSAMLFYSFSRMITRFSDVFTYWRVCKVDFFIWVVTFVSILTLDIVNGFIYSLIFSILTMLYRAQNRRCYMLGSIGSSDVYVPLVKYPMAHEIEGIKIFQFCGPIHYVCADLFESLLRQKTHVNVNKIKKHIEKQEVVMFDPRDLNLPSFIILDFSMISYIDTAGVRIITKIIEDYQSVNITILVASMASHVAKVVQREPLLWGAHKQRIYVTLVDAVHCAMRARESSALLR